MIFALSPQAKGRVERTAGTFQDRLVTELRLAGATTIEEANVVLNPNPPKDTDGRREDSGRGWVRELQGRWPGVLG